MLTHLDKKLTPKQMAAIVIGNLVELAPEDWISGEAVTDAERKAVKDQIAKYQQRIYILLGYDPSRKPAALESEEPSNDV